MKFVRTMWMPDDDEHFFTFFASVTDQPIYQISSFKTAMKYVKNFDCAVDIGAHVGFFSTYMAGKFKTVHAFEPEPLNFECLIENVPENVVCWNHGIAEKDMLGNMVNPCFYNSGAWEFHEDSLGTARMMGLGALVRPDFIKIDVQGMEASALKGCSEVLERDKPVLLVEGDKVSKHLEMMGYEMADKCGDDRVWVHK